MDINHWLNGGVRFFVVIVKSSYNRVPVRKLFPPNTTSADITGLSHYREYNVSVVAIDGRGSPFQSTVLQAKTDELGESKKFGVTTEINLLGRNQVFCACDSKNPCEMFVV